MNEILFSLLISFQEPEKKINIGNEIEISTIVEKIDNQKEINGKASLVFDLDSSTIIWEKNPNEKLQIASLTKLMTALIISENHKLDEVVEIKNDLKSTEGSKIGLEIGDKFKIRDLLKGLLIKSGNDSALALAIFDSGSEEEFVAKMNQRAAEIGLKNTNFENPIGFDSKENYSTVRDLAFLTKKILENNFLKKIVRTKEEKIYSLNKREIELKNTNILLGGEIKGVKTGTTEEAGQCLITLIEKDGKNILFVLLGSEERFDTTKGLMDFVFSKI